VSPVTPGHVGLAYWSSILNGHHARAWELLTSEVRRKVPPKALQTYAARWHSQVPADTGEWRVERVAPVRVGTDRAVYEVKLQHGPRLRAYMKREDGEWRVASPTGIEPFEWAERTPEERQIAAVARAYTERFSLGHGAEAFALLSLRSRSSLDRDRFVSMVKDHGRDIVTAIALFSPPDLLGPGDARMTCVLVQRADGRLHLSEMPMFLKHEATGGWRVRYGKADAPDLGKASGPGNPGDPCACGCQGGRAKGAPSCGRQAEAGPNAKCCAPPPAAPKAPKGAGK